MIDVRDFIESPSRAELESLVNAGTEHHEWWYDTTSRAEIMSMFYEAVDVDEVNRSALKRILPKSNTESDDDYNHRISRTPIIPFEKMFVRSKERIFQGHGVSRDLNEQDKENFWNDKFDHFDDQGDSIDKFFRKKVFHYKEVFGFGGVVVDLLTKVSTDEQGLKQYETYTDDSGEPIPYTYLVKPEEVYNFRYEQGYLKFVIIKQDVSHDQEEFDYRYTALTPEKVFVWEQIAQNEDIDEETEYSTSLIFESEHEFDEVPFVPIKGDPDINSAYKVGRPERYSLIPMYKSAIEIMYDLQEVSLLYGHPIPVMSEETVKQLIGAVDNQDKYKPETISAELGAVVQIPDNEEFPDTLFYQPDTQGLQHLREYLFDLIEAVHKFASIRDKSKAVANTSGVSKALDTVEERGVLASASRDMEETEIKTLQLMSQARSDVDFNKDSIKYQKDFDLSTSDEHFTTLIEGMAQGALSFDLYRYHALEGLRKSGAPQAVIERVKENLDSFGKPIKMDAADLLKLVENSADAKSELMEKLSSEIKILEGFSADLEESEENQESLEENNGFEEDSADNGNSEEGTQNN